MVCNSSCFTCSSPGISFVSIEALSVPQKVEYNQNVHISFNIQAGLLAAGTVAVCIYDIDNNICLQSKDLTVTPLGNYPMSFDISMPNRKLNLNISVVDAGIITNCEDVKTFYVDLYQPPGFTYGCNPTTGLCQQGFGGLPAGCGGLCTGTGSGTCASTDMKFLGICVPKQVVFMGFAIAGLYLVTKK